MSPLLARLKVCLPAFSLTLAAALFAAPPARAADPPAEFGRAGQIVLPELVGVRSGAPMYLAPIGLDAVAFDSLGWGGIVGYSRNDRSQTDPSSPGGTGKVSVSTESFWANPAVDVFVTRRLSIGVNAGASVSRQGFSASSAQAGPLAVSATSFAAAPRIGYVVPLGSGLSFWPRLSAGATYSQQTVPGASNAYLNWTGRSYFGSVDLAVVYHPVKHLMFQVAPQIGVGHSTFEGGSSGEQTWVRVGGEATAGLVF
jgi:hypothetical protein